MYVYYNSLSSYPRRSRVSRRTGVAPRRGVGQLTPTAITSQALATSATILALAPATGPAAPFVAAAAGLVGILGKLFSGCGQTCIQATQYANEAGSDLQNLYNQYFALPTPRYQSQQQAFIAAFNQVVAWLQQMCGNPALGQAGQRCIAERLVQRACPSTLNDSNIGGGQIDFCDYYSTFLDPVQNDPNVVPDPSPISTSSTIASTGSAISSLTQATIFGIPLTALALPAGLLLVAFLIGGDD